MFVLVLSFYWTHQVLKNVVRATVSGVVGTWWFSPIEAGSFCSTAVSASFIRSTTYSLGSICFGSLIVAILHMLRNSLRRAQSDRNGGFLRCIALCILTYIERYVCVVAMALAFALISSNSLCCLTECFTLSGLLSISISGLTSMPGFMVCTYFPYTRT